MKRLACVAAVLVAAGVVALLCREEPAEENGVSLSIQSSAKMAQASSKASVPAAVGFLESLPTNQTATVRDTKPYVLKSATRFNKALRLEVEAMGARIAGVRSATELMIEATPSVRRRLAADGRFESVSEFLPTDKIAPRLVRELDAGAKSVQVTLLTLSPADHQLVQDWAVAQGGKLLTGCFNEGTSFRIELSAELVAELAARGDVRWMEKFVRPELTNDMAVMPGAMNVQPVWNTHGLHGEGQLVSTSDSGIDTGVKETIHPDLRNRVRLIKIVDECDRSDIIGHGTHTAGSIVGDGTNSEGKIRGVAWEAELCAWFCGYGGRGIATPSRVGDLFRPDNEKCYIHSASWGADVYGEYNSECADIDLWTWRNPDFLPVFSAGNRGSVKCSIGAPGSAKNVLTVGATQNLRTSYPADDHPTGDPTRIASFSSRGPCTDGRTKPDVSAPGVGILSTRSSLASYDRGMTPTDDYPYDGYAWECGTSMSCPLTAGAMTLVREWLVKRQGYSNAVPTAALMKAVVSGGATGGEKPDGDFGWGCVDLEGALFPSDRAVQLIDRIPYVDGEDFSWIIETTNAAPLEVQLAWVDYPADASARQSAAKLVNDLDLTVTPMDGGDVLYGNGGAKPDRLNNMESVRIASAAPGKYLVTVKGANVLYDAQDGGAAALYIRGAFDPAKTENGSDRIRIVDGDGKPLNTQVYFALEDALDAGFDYYNAGNAVTFQVCRPAVFAKPWTLGYDCTICSTNDDPAAAPVAAAATLTLAPKTHVLFTNVVFTGGTPVLKVGGGAVARLAGTVGLDRIDLEGDGELVMAGELDPAYAYRVKPAEGHTGLGEVFGHATVDLETARKYAGLFVNWTETELIGEAVDDGNGGVELRWVIGDVPDSATVARLNQSGTSIKFADLKVLAKYVTNDAEIVVTTNCALGGFLNVVGKRVAIRSENGSTVTPVREHGANESAAGLKVVDGGELTVSNLTFKGFAQFGDSEAFVVVGTNSAFRMSEGACIRDIYNISGYGAALVRGTMSVTNGASVLSCMAESSSTAVGCGGGIYLADAARLELCGGTVADCHASDLGGGVYVSPTAKVVLSGPARVTGNSQLQEYSPLVSAVADDLYVCDRVEDPELGPVTVTTDILEVTDGMAGASVGLRLLSNQGRTRDDVLGTDFAAVADGADGESAAKAFYSNVHNKYDLSLVGALGPTGGTLVWGVKDNKPGTVPESQALVKVEKGGETDFYADLASAFAVVRTGDVAVVTILTNVMIAADIKVQGEVTLTASRSAFKTVYQRAVSWKVDDDVNNAKFFVSGPDNSLCLTNITLTGSDLKGSHPYGTVLEAANGGRLTLEAEAAVSAVVGSDDKRWPLFESEDPPNSAIRVSSGATLTMKAGASVIRCTNDLDPDNANTSGGGILLTDTNTVFRFEGGVVTNCTAMRGGGVVIENDAQFVVSGSGLVIENNIGNLYSSQGGLVVLADVFDGSVGHTLGIVDEYADPNVFGRVADDCPVALPLLATSAANFFKDADPSVTGRIVTNATEALLVWSDAVRDGAFAAKDGTVYGEVLANAVMWPSAVKGLVYNGSGQTGVVAGVGYTLTGNFATNAAYYTAIAKLDAGKVWVDGTTADKQISWQIGRATYDMSGVTFDDATYEEDGAPKSIFVAGTLPADVTVSYEGNGQTTPGAYTVTAKFTGDAVNYNAIDDMTATLTITAKEDPDPQWTVVTNQPSEIAFKSIDRVNDTEWALVITDRVEFCNYRLIYTDDLAKGFTHTGKWEQAHAAGPWATNVITTGGAWFWRAEGTEGTNMVPPQVEN